MNLNADENKHSLGLGASGLAMVLRVSLLCDRHTGAEKRRFFVVSEPDRQKPSIKPRVLRASAVDTCN